MKMAGKVIPDVTLASADPQLLLCWEEKVRLGAECSLLLKHSKGKIFTILKSSSFSTQKPNVPSSTPEIPPKAGKKKRKTRNKKKRLESLLAYHQRLVTDKGMPPSNLMVQHAAALSSPLVQTELEETRHFNCDICNFTSNSKLGVDEHIGISHKGQQKPVKSIAEEFDSKQVTNIPKDKQSEEENYIKLKCKICENSFQTSDALNEHWELELYCKTCEQCIQGVYEGQSKHCLPDDEVHTTHEWHKVSNKCNECVYVTKNSSNLQMHIKKKHDK